MTRTILLPVLLLSGLAFAADPAPAAPAAPAAPTAPAATPAKPATPATTAPATTAPAAGKAIPIAVFKDVDKNNDKALDKAELATIADLIRDFNIVDTDKNGKLNEAEYTAWAEKQKQM